MVRITEDLLRKRAEHNEKEIHSLEEISLHQLDIERIENIDKWCPNLQILYLHGNLISKIENVKRLKRLTYLNLTMNNICIIENLSGCESLKKIDLTVNFIRKLSSILELKENYNLRELYLTGNPCTAYEGYREYVINTLPQLSNLDGKIIERSERILALQNIEKIQIRIFEQEAKEEIKWELSQQRSMASDDDDDDDTDSEIDKAFWSQKTKHTPEFRMKLHHELQKMKGKTTEVVSHTKQKRKRNLTGKDGRFLNINEPKVDFLFTDEGDSISLEVFVYRYLDTSLLYVDVQPNYVQIFIKDKLLQLVLDEEVMPDQSVAKRSQTTGHMIIRMPKVKQTLVPLVKTTSNLKSEEKSKNESREELVTVATPVGSLPSEDPDIPELI